VPAASAAAAVEGSSSRSRGSQPLALSNDSSHGTPDDIPELAAASEEGSIDGEPCVIFVDRG
jgi:hypothetical protein